MGGKQEGEEKTTREGKKERLAEILHFVNHFGTVSSS